MKARTAGILSFLAVFAVVVAGGAVVGLSMDQDTAPGAAPEHVELDNPQYDADRLTSESSPGTADIQLDSDAFESHVVVHMGGSATKRTITPLLNALVRDGHNVTVISDGFGSQPGGPVGFSEGAVNQRTTQVGGSQSELSSALETAHGLISIGVNSYSDEDLNAIGSFVESGGRMVATVEPSQEFALGEGLSEVYGELDAYTEPGYVYNLEENDLNYQRIFAQSGGDSMLTAGVDRVVLDSATPVQASTVDERLVPIDGTELSVTRAETEKPVLVRNGDVALIGDTQFMTPENTQRADNDVFVGNIAEFLVEADRTFDNAQEGT
ncbi:hypothetical protein [Halovenus salina]|uniref:GATase domain protein n=1 Tax=Halovenus salina TaxID=1510225 RepID=A0ABD5W059_9EURY|nr:hypothetical protein [Halovenus salina]